MGGSKYDYDEDDDDDQKKIKAEGNLLKEFECPGCNAHNPCDERVPSRGLELRCHYCGVEYKVTVSDEGRFKFKEN